MENNTQDTQTPVQTAEEAKTKLQSLIGDKYCLTFAYESCILIPYSKKISKDIVGNEQIPCLKFNQFFNKHKDILLKKQKDFEDSNNECECSYLLRKSPLIYLNSSKHSSGSICAIRIYCEKEGELNAIFNLFQKIYKEKFDTMIVKYSAKLRKLIIKKDSLEQRTLEMKVF